MTNSSSQSPHKTDVTPNGHTRFAPNGADEHSPDPVSEFELETGFKSGETIRDRYRIISSLGTGGFGGVYLAQDIELGRRVAIKRQRGQCIQDVELARNEARFIAGLDHPNIVKIYDMIEDDRQEGVLIIMEYVSGVTLQELLRRKRLSILRSLELASEIAEALVHAHSRRIIHRDLKPGNVLLDGDERVKLSDFGLALGAINLETAPSAAGTPRYMAPEQVRGESHRIDGRTDIWALGVMLYEMLCGVVPFSGPTRGATFEAVLHDEPPPPRQWNPHIPEAVENVILRCLRKRSSERPASAMDLLEDLRECRLLAATLDADTGVHAPVETPALDSRTPRTGSTTLGGPLRMEPKGLRPYDEGDAVHFLDLIPGPRERSGLPESIHFWKKWAAGDSVDEYASVGVLYGPSGAGKTSFVRAGLIHHLDHDICPIVIECRKGDLARRIETAIRSRFQPKGASGSLSKLLSGLRTSDGAIFGYRKILLILDQFESWSASADAEERRALADALRHCDGKSLQALFVVRDDYWSGITEIMKWIDVPLIERRNVRSLELLDPRHAQRILEGIGRAHGILPRAPQPLNAEQERFIREAVAGLAKNDRVIAVHLVMFAQIVHVLPWTPQMLHKQGGVEGACTAYLHEIFDSPNGPPSYRRLSGVVADILNELLPPYGEPLKASARSIDELRARALGGAASAKIAEAVRILSEDLKLITLTRSDNEDDSSETEYYQLAHDFLVEPVRNWVEVARKSTWRGRAAARLAELSELWQRKPQPQFLPTLREFAEMQLVVPRSSRNEKQTRFLRAAGRYHAGKAAATAVAAVVAAICAMAAVYQYSAAADAVRNKRAAEVSLFVYGKASEVPRLLDELGRDDRNIPIVNAVLQSSAEPHVRIRAGLLAQRMGKAAFENVANALEDAEPELFSVILRGAAAPDGEAALEAVCSDPNAPELRRIRAALLLLYTGHDREVRKWLTPEQMAVAADAKLIEVVRSWRGDPKPWQELLADSPNDPDVQFVALTILGSFSKAELDNSLDWPKIEALQESPLAQVRNASRWLLHYAGRPFAEVAPPPNADWMITPVMKIEMRKVDPGMIRRWDHAETDDRLHVVRLESPIWAAVVVADRRLHDQFQAETSTTKWGKSIDPLANNANIEDAAEIRPERPAAGWRVDEVIEFCNWLSRKEELPEQYEEDGVADSLPEKNAPKWKLAAMRGGFRLPLPNEFEYLALAGAEKGAPWYARQKMVLGRYPTGSKTIDELDRSLFTFPPNRLGIFINDDNHFHFLYSNSGVVNSVGIHEQKVQLAGYTLQFAPSFYNLVLVVRDDAPSP